MKPKTNCFLFSVFLLSAYSSHAAIVFMDDFESPDANTTYTLANTSGTANTTKWVRATDGFNSTRNGIVDENRVGETFVDPVGSQAYGFRYSSNTGLTSAFAQIGTLTAGQTITISFNVMQDNYSGSNYAAYSANLVLFDGAGTRSSTTNFINNTAAVLARSTGNATSNSSWDLVTFSYTVGDAVFDNNGATAGTSTSYLSSLEGKDIAIRFAGQGNGAVIDNVSIEITSIPEPSAALLGGLGVIALLRRRKQVAA